MIMFKIPTDPMIMFIIPTQTPVLKTNNVGIVNTSWSISQIWDLGIQSGESNLGTQLAYGLEQITGLERKKDENPLWKHCQIAHNSMHVCYFISLGCSCCQSVTQPLVLVAKNI